MSFFKNLFGFGKVDGEALARSDQPTDRAQMALLAEFAEPRRVHDERARRAWERALPRDYDQQLGLFQKWGWLTEGSDDLHTTPAAAGMLQIFAERQEAQRQAAMEQVRGALAERDTSEALAIRRRYEAAQPLGTARWTGPDPQLSHSALTRRILFLEHGLVADLDAESERWLKEYAAEQHLWGASWRLPDEAVPPAVATALRASRPGAALSAAEIAFWRAQALARYVENQETWQRCNGGDHVRRIEVQGPDDSHTCAECRAIRGEQFLVARVPELPHPACTSVRGCRCEYVPVLDTYEDLPE